MTVTKVALPMYDWPEIRPQTDQLFRLLHESLSDYGFKPDQHLSRKADPMAFWQRPDLLLAQTCGLPYSRFLHDKVGLVGTPSYDIECSAGQYFSVVIVGPKVTATQVKDLAGLRFAVNDDGSQSGFSAPIQAFQQADSMLPGSLHILKTGSHRHSIQAVASGAADVAAIDAVCWALAQRHEPTVQRVRVLTRTAVTPGLPWISAYRDAQVLFRLHQAVVYAMATLNEPVRDALLLSGFSQTRPIDYLPFAERYPGSESFAASERFSPDRNSDSKCKL